METLREHKADNKYIMYDNIREISGEQIAFELDSEGCKRSQIIKKKWEMELHIDWAVWY